MSVVVGIDPSLTISGCARVDLGVGAEGQLEAVRWETWRARAEAPEVATPLTNRRRIRVMLREILSLVPESFDLAVVESASMGSAGPKRNKLTDETGGLRWMLIDQLMPRGPVALVSPKTRAKVATDNGNADKKSVHAAMRDVFPAAHIPASGEGRFDVADAVALAGAGAYWLGLSWSPSRTQATALAKVAWPVGGRVLAGMKG